MKAMLCLESLCSNINNNTNSRYNASQPGLGACAATLEHVTLQETAAKLRKEDREVGRGRKWRSNYRLLNQEVVVLEEEEKNLELVYPQVTPLLFLPLPLGLDYGQETHMAACLFCCTPFLNAQ